MGIPFFVSFPDEGTTPAEPQDDGRQKPVYVKHVVIKDTEKSIASFKRIDNSLFLQRLLSSTGNSTVLQQLTVVQFLSNDKNFITEVLNTGIECNGSQYHYLGQSSSQLRSKTCFMIDATRNDIYQVLKEFGNFYEIFPLARRTQTIGRIFTPFSYNLNLKDDDFDVIDDITSALGAYVFTDGCDFMSPELSYEVQKLYNLSYSPSVIEIRFKNFSGVLVRFNEMPNMRKKALFRKSMADFRFCLEEMSEGNVLGVVNYSQPHSLGYLDILTVMLLTEKGVPKEHFEKMQADYHQLIRNLEDRTFASYFLRTTGNEDLLKALKTDGLSQRMLKELHDLKIKETKNMKAGKCPDDNEEKEGKYQREWRKTNEEAGEENDRQPQTNSSEDSCSKSILEDPYVDQDFRIFTPDARVVYGVCDPYGQLNYGECVFQPTLHRPESDTFALAENVVVIRRPSFDVQDVIVLKLAHGKEAYKDLHDCIVFPSKGIRPHAFECAGGRVGGDKYFVSWDPGLIPQFVSSPYVSFAETTTSKLVNKTKELLMNLKCFKEKKPASEGEQSKHLQKAHMEIIEHFANFEDQENLRKRARNLFLNYASLFGSTCPECELLKKMIEQEFDCSLKSELISKKLVDLEEKYNKELQRFAKLSHTRPLSSQPLRPLGMWDKLLISLHWRKPAFCPGDDIWNSIKKKNVEFVTSENMV